MQVRLNNIGIISDSVIELGGLTVITGHNNSGKSTVGKVLYSIISAVENLQAHAFEDKKNFALSQAQSILSRFGLGMFGVVDNTVTQNFKMCRMIVMDIDKEIEGIKNISDLCKALKQLQDEMLRMTKAELKNIGDGEILSNEDYSQRQQTAEDDLLKLIQIIQGDSELIEYASSKINKTLNREFNEQILPVAVPESVGRITVTDKMEKYYYDLKIIENNIVQGKRGYYKSAYEDVIFLDDVYIIDSLTSPNRTPEFVLKVPIRSRRNRNINFNENIYGEEHKEDLIRKLKEKPDNLFEEMVNAKAAKEILEKIDDIFPDRVELFDGKYVCADSKLDIRNLATGSKMFAIIKMLLERGALTDRTLLILDEPESHLHPEWQNDLAEVIVLLQKYDHIDILLTTHSPNFLMALEANAKKYKIWSATNIYDTEKMKSSRMVQYKNVKENLQTVYKKLAEPLFENQQLLEEIEG